VAAGLAVLATTVPALRLAIFHSSPGDMSLTEGSTEDHWKATFAGAKDAITHPFGQGVGTAGPASFYNTTATPKIAEDYFVQISQEVGLLGLALFIIICVLLVYDLFRQRGQMLPMVLLASFAGVSVINLFLHAWVDDPTSMVWWALAGLFVYNNKKGGTNGQRNQAIKKTT